MLVSLKMVMVSSHGAHQIPNKKTIFQSYKKGLFNSSYKGEATPVSYPFNLWIVKISLGFTSWWFQPNLKNISQIANLPQIRGDNKNIRNHQVDKFRVYNPTKQGPGYLAPLDFA